jgi:hypothetical protein
VLIQANKNCTVERRGLITGGVARSSLAAARNQDIASAALFFVSPTLGIIPKM